MREDVDVGDIFVRPELRPDLTRSSLDWEPHVAALRDELLARRESLRDEPR